MPSGASLIIVFFESHARRAYNKRLPPVFFRWGHLFRAEELTNNLACEKENKRKTFAL
jgi:hypothetical protein